MPDPYAFIHSLSSALLLLSCRAVLSVLLLETSIDPCAWRLRAAGCDETGKMKLIGHLRDADFLIESFLMEEC